MIIRLGKTVFALALAVVLLGSSSIATSAAPGIKQSDFKLTGGVADVGATVAMTLRGSLDREIRAIAPGFRVSPSFTVTQTCRNETNPADTQVARVTTIQPFATVSVVTTFTDPGHGRWVYWTMTLNYDPLADAFLGRPNPPTFEKTICAIGYRPTTPLTVSDAAVRLWPTAGGPPLGTTKGEFLMITVNVSAGHTKIGPTGIGF